MSKRLILIRHAKSSWNNSQITDKERPLNSRGQYVAPIMGQWLNGYCTDNNIQTIDFLVSTATRTQQTLKLLTSSITASILTTTSLDEVYLASSQSLQNLITKQSDDSDCIALIGHNPGMHMLVEHFTGERLNKFPTCAIACFQFDSNHWLNLRHTNCISSEIKTPKQLLQ